MQPDIVLAFFLLNELLHSLARIIEAALDRSFAALHNFSNLPDIQPYGAIYIYSSSEPFNEEAQIDFERLKAWVQKYKMEWAGGSDWGEEGEFHASGHIDGFGLKKMIDTIRPRILLPIHTETPEFFEQFAGPDLQVIFPQNGQEIRLA